MEGQLLHYGSRLDAELQPLPVCATDDGTGEKALILDVSPGAIANLERSAKQCEMLANRLRDEGVEAVIAKPCGRGPGSVYQGPGEVDFWEAVEALCGIFPIDRERISVTGGSMGGAATWYLASHYPDRLAAAAPFCGYCDYRLWTKPGGLIMRTMSWEEPSWVARGAAFRVGNLRHIALRITHGEWDIGIGGGVPVEHSRQMSRMLAEAGIAHEYEEVPKCGHGCSPPERLVPAMKWMADQRLVRDPEHITLTVHGLRHSRSHWVTVEQMEAYGEAATVDAKVGGASVTVTTSNVRRLGLGPSDVAAGKALRVDRQAVPGDVGAGLTLVREADGWAVTTEPAPPGEKRHGCSGPVGDVVFEPLRLAFGSQGSEQETFLGQWMAGELPRYFQRKNGGVHRGIFEGESWHLIPHQPDHSLSDKDIETCNLWLLGTHASNSVLKRFEGQLPLEFGDGWLEVGGKRFRGRALGASACFPSPANPNRYVLVWGGTTPEALTGATHLNLQLLPDYLVWDGDEVLESGAMDADWTAPR